LGAKVHGNESSSYRVGGGSHRVDSPISAVLTTGHTDSCPGALSWAPNYTIQHDKTGE